MLSTCFIYLYTILLLFLIRLNIYPTSILVIATVITCTCAIYSSNLADSTSCIYFIQR